MGDSASEPAEGLELLRLPELLLEALPCLDRDAMLVHVHEVHIDVREPPLRVANADDGDAGPADLAIFADTTPLRLEARDLASSEALVVAELALEILRVRDLHPAAVGIAVDYLFRGVAEKAGMSRVRKDVLAIDERATHHPHGCVVDGDAIELGLGERRR